MFNKSRSVTTPMHLQLQGVIQAVQADPMLADGFNFYGESQVSLVTDLSVLYHLLALSLSCTHPAMQPVPPFMTPHLLPHNEVTQIVSRFDKLLYRVQGGLLARAYVTMSNNPPVHNLVALCGPQSGIGECPFMPSTADAKLCAAVAAGLDVYRWPFCGFCGYWKGTYRDEYLNNSQWLVRGSALKKSNSDCVCTG